MKEYKKLGVGFGVILLKNKKVLLGLRHSDPQKADSELHGEGTWTLPGGKLEFGEEFEQGAKREVMEETGIKLNSVKIISVQNDKVHDAHFVTIGMLAENFEGDPKIMEPDEITRWQWFESDKLPKPMYFPSKKMLEIYKKGLVYKK